MRTVLLCHCRSPNQKRELPRRTSSPYIVVIRLMPMYDIEVVRDGLGPPRLVLHGAAAEVAREAGVRRWLVTMSHTSTLAQATVVAL